MENSKSYHMQIYKFYTRRYQEILQTVARRFANSINAIAPKHLGTAL